MAKGKNAKKRLARKGVGANPNPNPGTQLSPASVVPTISKAKKKRDKKKAKTAAAAEVAANAAAAAAANAPAPAPIVSSVPAPDPALAPIVPNPAPVSAALELSPFYYALRELYLHLKEPEGFKHISIPRLRLYLKKLQEIKKSDKLKIGGKDLWQTLNPPSPNFRAEQLLEEVAGKKNILEEAIAKQEQHYVPEFKSELNASGKKYEPTGKCYYIEMIGGTLYLMIRDGAKPSLEELEEAIAAYAVICQDMNDSTEAKLYICDDAFTRDSKNQKNIAAVVTHLDLTLADAAVVQDGNKTVHKAVHEFSQQMKEPEPTTAKAQREESDLKPEILLNYDLMTPKGRLVPSSETVKNPEQMKYLDTVAQLEQNTKQSYLQGVATLNRVLPGIDEGTYKQERMLVQLKPLGVEVQKEVEKRATQRKLHCEEEQQLQEAIKNPLQSDIELLEKDSKEVAAKEKETVRAYSRQEASVEQSDEELEQALQASLETYKQEQRNLLQDKYHYTIEDVRGDGNCFYRAVADQMEQQQLSKFKKDGVELHTSLRRLVQGENSENREWANVYHLLKLVKETDVVIAVVDTRYPELGFRCYFKNNRGEIAETYYPSEFAKEAVGNKTIIRLAYTGNHYMSVRGHNALRSGALRTAFDIAQPPVPAAERSESQVPSAQPPVLAAERSEPPVSLSGSPHVFLPNPNPASEKVSEQPKEIRKGENEKPTTVGLSVRV